MVLILFPEEHIHPELSGKVLHSSPSRHGSISHHHFPITMDAEGRQADGGGLVCHPACIHNPSMFKTVESSEKRIQRKNNNNIHEDELPL